MFYCDSLFDKLTGVFRKKESKTLRHKIGGYMSIYIDPFSFFIDSFNRAKNCQDALNILKLLKENNHWNEEFRKNSSLKDQDEWYEYVKSNIEICIGLIEANDIDD